MYIPVYSLYIPCKIHVLAFLVAHPRLEASDRDFLWISSVLAREAAHARLGSSKVPQPGVDLVNMAAPPRVRARPIGTAVLKSVLLSAVVLVWNCGGCITVQKAWYKRNSAKKVLNPSYVESGNR